MRAKSDIISELFAAYDGDVKLLVSDLKKHATKFKKSSKKKTDYTKNSVVAEARGISRLYHPGKDNQVTALDDVSVRIHESEIVALVGPSGSGKSTLLNIFAGLDKPSNGTIVVGDSDITKMSDAELSPIVECRVNTPNMPHPVHSSSPCSSHLVGFLVGLGLGF
ncbi:MAG: ATP-binding cassette domain-containing protein, partial [Patescibacteria group bacterium]